jgi:hypothetical protein
MAEDTPYVPPGAEGEESDVLGKLDHLLNKHKPRPRDPESDPVPVLTEALAQDKPDAIPTLTDIVTPGVTPPAAVDHHGDLVRRLAMRLEVERDRLAAESAGDTFRIQTLHELSRRLSDSLAEIVREAREREAANR